MEAGLHQRIKALNLFLYDVYHDRRILREKVVPAELVLKSKCYRPEMIGFDPDVLTLAVSFRSGAEYHYYNVPPEVFHGFQAAASPGNYLDAYVKKAGYAYVRVR